MIYADFDVRHDPEIVFYPDSDKIGILVNEDFMVLPVSQQVDYYKDE